MAEVMIRALNHELFCMTNKTYGFWCPEVPRTIKDDLNKAIVDVNVLPILRIAPLPAPIRPTGLS